MAYGYQLMGAQGRERKVSSDWVTEQDALAALIERLAAVQAGELGRPGKRNFGEMVAEYLTHKRNKRNRTVTDDKRILTGRLLPALGKDVNVRRLTAPVIAQCEKRPWGM